MIVCVCEYTCIYVYLYICIYLHIYRMNISVCMFACVCGVYFNEYTYILTYIQHIHGCIKIYVYTYVYSD